MFLVDMLCLAHKISDSLRKHICTTNNRMISVSAAEWFILLAMPEEKTEQ